MGNHNDESNFPILNLIAKDNQCAYKAKRSTADAIFRTNQFMKNEICGHIAFDLSKAFGRINRDKLWWILYEKGLPIKLIRYIWLGRDVNLLQGKYNGITGSKIHNNKGVPRGSVISALLYTTFDDSIVEEYKMNYHMPNMGNLK